MCTFTYKVILNCIHNKIVTVSIINLLKCTSRNEKNDMESKNLHLFSFFYCAKVKLVFEPLLAENATSHDVFFSYPENEVLKAGIRPSPLFS